MIGSWSFAGSEMDRIDGMNFVSKGSSIISPENDSRLNLYLLWRDINGLPAPDFLLGKDPKRDYLYFNLAYKDEILRNHLAVQIRQKKGWSWYGNQRCHSVEAGSFDYISAVLSNTSISKPDKEALVKMRHGVDSVCDYEKFYFDTNELSNNEVTKFYFFYLVGANEFYKGNFSGALYYYDSMLKAGLLENEIFDPWIKEAIMFMAARSELNLVQEYGYDRWGDFVGLPDDKVSKFDQVIERFRSYLQTYPQGKYASSANGLIRRVYWVFGKNKELVNEYYLISAAADDTYYFETLVSEIDSKIITNQNIATEIIDDPIILAARLLILMRPKNDLSASLSPNEILTIIEDKNDILLLVDGLYELLLGNFYIHVASQPEKALEVIDNAKISSVNDYSINFSLQFLKGFALNRLISDEEDDHWRNLLAQNLNNAQRGPIESWLGDFMAARNRIDDVFKNDFPIINTSIRRDLIKKNISTETLREVFKSDDRSRPERNYALFTLLFRHLFNKDYGTFLEDSDLVPLDALQYTSWWGLRSSNEIPLGLFFADLNSKEYNCPENVYLIIENLMANPQNLSTQLCLAEFYLENDVVYLSWMENYSGVTEIYSKILDSNSASRNEKAFALYRSILCYKYGMNRCDGPKVDVSERKNWFEKLKLDYSETEWSRKLEYYW